MEGPEREGTSREGGREDESGTLRDPPALSRTQVAHQVAAKSPPVKPTR
eukprot:COSAG01_NODE_7527_length_3165_cov_203.129159_1_plen_48_part_10